ncbi:MAG: competence protein ComJ [Phycisphaerales bacterium]
MTRRMYFSYSFFLVYDSGDVNPVFDWQDVHVAQGFARSQTSACFRSMLEFGDAEVDVVIGAYESRSDHVRVIEVPLKIDSGVVAVEGPEDFGEGLRFEVGAGSWLVTAAQTADSERIDLFFERTSTLRQFSRVIVGDEELSPMYPLAEYCPPIELA